MSTLSLVLTLSCWIVNGDLILAIFSQLARIVIVLSSMLSIDAEEPPGLMALALIGV